MTIYTNDYADDGDGDNDFINDDDDQEELSRWKKRSIFFDLPYWEVSLYVLVLFIF